MLIHLFTVFIAAFLLFFVQPMMGRRILPWFGGSSAVWSTSLLFFQTLLLAGYAYSHGLVRRLRRKRQVMLHLSLVTVSLLLLAVNALVGQCPLMLPRVWAVQEVAPPVLSILFVLGASVGLPYFVLSTSGPLLQSWFDARAGSPYWLYALSNFGSLTALLAYPIFIEPHLSLQHQTFMWAGGYALFVLGMGIVTWRTRAQFEDGEGSTRATLPVREAASPVPLSRQLLWLGLSACASMLLVAVTQEITQNVASVPLLWVVPLALYLLTFILTFGCSRCYGRAYAIPLWLSSLSSLLLLARGNAFPLSFQVIIHSLTLFLACMICHGELVRLRPDRAHLTRYYLIIALGGALGSVFVNLIAPVIFDSFWEFPLGLLLCWAMLTAAVGTDAHMPFIRSQRWARTLLFALVVLAVASLSYGRAFRRLTVYAERNFYGGVRVQAWDLGDPYGMAYVLIHGTTIHGLQYTSPAMAMSPTGYFGPGSGIGSLLQVLNKRAPSNRVGVLGMGIGTLAAYGRAQDVYRLYEINPQVIQLAQGQGGYFHYVQDAPAELTVVEGDARLALERELAQRGSQEFDLLIVDVFSGDAMPVHLLTAESLALYLAHLVPEGVLAVNISTTHVNVEPVLAKLAQHFDLHAIVVEDAGAGQPCCRSRWALLARDADLLDIPALASCARPLENWGARMRLWTDDYSNLWQILR